MPQTERDFGVNDQRVKSALSRIDALIRGNVEALLQSPDPYGWRFVPSEDPETMLFAYKREIPSGSASVAMHGSGESGQTVYTMVFVINDSVYEDQSILAEALFDKIESERGEAVNALSKTVRLPLLKTDSNTNLPLLSNKDVLDELKNQDASVASVVFDILSLGGSFSWVSEPPKENEGDTFAYKLDSGDFRVVVRYSGDLTDHVKGSYELNIFKGNEPFFNTSYSIAEHLFETIEAHRGELAVYRENVE